MTIFAMAALVVGVLAISLVVVRVWGPAREPKHRHHHGRVGYGGAGWSLYECACGAKEIDA